MPSSVNAVNEPADSTLLYMLPYDQGHYRWDENENKWRPANSAVINHLIGNRRGVLREHHAYRTKDGRTALANKGMEFDGGSKPRATWILVGHPWEDYLLDYIIHDALREQAQDAYLQGDISRKRYRELMKQADDVFKESQQWTKCKLLNRTDSRWERTVIRVKYQTVRLHAWYREFKDSVGKREP
jgi:hypothetical protein